jgi:hypothetical protein
VLTDFTCAVSEAVDAPDGTVRLPGTVTALSLLASVTLRPPDGAAEVSETIQAVDPAPVNELLPHESALIDGVKADDGPVRLIDVFFETVPCVAVNVTVCDVLTLEALAGKLAFEAPEATDTEAGTVTALLLLARLTVKPPLGAGALKVTLQESEPAPIIDELAQLSPAREAVEEEEPLPCNFTAPATVTFVLVIALTLSCPMESVADPGS